MTTNRVLRLNIYGGPDALELAQAPIPQREPGQVLVRVRAAGVNGLDWKLREGFLRDAMPLPLPAVLGLEFAGEVMEAGPNSAFRVGDRVLGPLSGIGAYADVVAVDEANFARTPEALSDVEAAALPVVALTAAQVLEAAGPLQSGTRVLIHGAAGGVGGFVVQLAKAAGAEVWATASARSRDHVLGLGADQVIDREAQRFEDEVADVDLVLDLVGGDAVERSWRVLKERGVLVSTVRPDVIALAPAGKRGLWFMMRPDAARLQEIADAVAAGTLRSTVAEVVGLKDLSAAIERNRTGHAPGKIVADLTLA
jgi:NADPH:quinone reductase-like Zn-dependent oxidoreductase